MTSAASELQVDYLVKSLGGRAGTAIFVRGGEVAKLTRESESGLFRLKAADGKRAWVLDPRVGGEARPFSLKATRAGSEKGEPELLIRNHLFEYEGKHYLFAGVPEGRPLRDFLSGKRYICRLDALEPLRGDIDHMTWHSLRRIRGPIVGELDGVGAIGHHVLLSPELEPVGLILSAASYIMYSTG